MKEELKAVPRVVGHKSKKSHKDDNFVRIYTMTSRTQTQATTEKIKVEQDKKNDCPTVEVRSSENNELFAKILVILCAALKQIFKHQKNELKPPCGAEHQSHQNIDHIHVKIQETSEIQIKTVENSKSESRLRKSLIPRPVRFFSEQKTNGQEQALYKSRIPRRIICHQKKQKGKQLHNIELVSEDKTLHRKEIFAGVIWKFRHRSKGTTSTQSELPQNFRKNKCFGL